MLVPVLMLVLMLVLVLVLVIVPQVEVVLSRHGPFDSSSGARVCKVAAAE